MIKAGIDQLASCLNKFQAIKGAKKIIKMLVRFVPSTIPRLNSSALRRLIAAYQIDREKYPLIVVGIRGYYLNSLGKPGENDRGIYE